MEELTTNPPRDFTWVEREQGACAMVAARFEVRRDPKTSMEVARAWFCDIDGKPRHGASLGAL